ncbi:Chromatin structure-remodeling complex subunit rsc9 [Psilocybe cubensis]|uniref:Chromatin structure-remodeling complex subunit rsc9 n=2 Tax=Psilocybe cubensis TaxID=181762 RepID=A0ACB8HG94_PSICU|nr:Chromatin structure-remodeling complex subunit rsc9 [Psilocybe cubensis]KAH9486506.1 Chromatin structure-remodeling complex subunit rsc9 [Psilocybe cubensis]
MATFINNRGVPQQAQYYRPPSYQPQAPPAPRLDVRDDYERWYTERVPNNRMALSIRSGIPSEITWALDRLCRLVNNNQFMFIPGVIDGLFDWPEWYVREGYKNFKDAGLLFSVSPASAQQRQFALESLFILGNAALYEPNAETFARHSHTIPLILNALHTLDHKGDCEALLHILNIFHFLASVYVVHPAAPAISNPIPPLLRIVSETSNRTMIIATLTTLTSLLSNPANGAHLSAQSEALAASIRYLPLFIDKPLIDACLNYLYCHISHPSMARAFLLHPEMSAVLKVLSNLLIHEQRAIEKTFTIDITGPIYTAPSTTQPTRDHDLTKEELENLVQKPEPQRCYDWMRAMFLAKADGELTQVDFWTLYKDAFSPYAEQHPLLVASDVIKNVTSVFPQAQAMVLQGPVQRFVVRGVDRRKESAASERYRCQWNRSQCTSSPFSSPTDLYDHVLQHLESAETAETSCLWSACSQAPLSKRDLSVHTLTHISSTQPMQKHPSQSDTITLPTENYPHPVPTPTSRPPPPPRSTTITYDAPIADPPSTSLTALLIIRILFRTSFASSDAAPRVDADHFGFPGLVEETDDPSENAHHADGIPSGDDKEGERRGRRAFVGIRKLLEEVKIRDDVLMGWITEMVDAAMPYHNE